ncbi:MAG: thioredoxin family protein [Comamonadaceae bacterium]|nr:thioredoxin family protein [Comamonadaceae bacterium]
MGWEYLVAGLALAIVLMQIVPLIRARRMRGRAVPELDAMLNDAQRGEERLLVYFLSPGCGACRPMTPVMDKLAAERGNVVKVNVAESLALGAALRRDGDALAGAGGRGNTEAAPRRRQVGTAGQGAAAGVTGKAALCALGRSGNADRPCSAGACRAVGA